MHCAPILELQCRTWSFVSFSDFFYVSLLICLMFEVDVADRITEILARRDADPPTMKEIVAEVPTVEPPENMPSDKILNADWTNEKEVIALKGAITRHLFFNTSLTTEQITVLKEGAFKKYEFFKNHPGILVCALTEWIQNLENDFNLRLCFYIGIRSTN